MDYKSFKEIDEQIKDTYYNSDDDTIKDFLVPVLKRSMIYKRESYSFSSAIFSLLSDALIEIVKNGCKIYYIIGIDIPENDVTAIEEGLSDEFDFIEKNIINDFNSVENFISRLNSRYRKEVFEHRLKMLSYLVSKGILNIKIGFVCKNGRIVNPSRSKFHPKVMIFTDFEGNSIVANGSTNESLGGHSHNEESFDVFKSWNENSKSWFNRHFQKFDEFWDNSSENIKTIDVNKLVESKILQGYKSNFRNKEEMIKIEEELNQLLKIDNKNNIRKENYKKRDGIELRHYQKEAITNWLKKKYGLFVMATGTGKTYTALGCIQELIKNKEKLGIVIVTPQNSITSQWIDSLKSFNLECSEISGCSFKELSIIANNIMDLKLDNKDYFIIGTTYDTYYQEKFINELNKFKGKLMIVADEVHNAGTDCYQKGLLEKYTYRLGLSATPERYFDKEGSKYIYNYFYKGNFDQKEGETYSLDISDAIKTINPSTGETFLVPYEYYFHICELTVDEFELFEVYSKKIARLSAILKDNKNNDKKGLSILMNQRKKILKAAQNKINICDEIMEKSENLKKTLFFLDTNEQINKLIVLVNKKYPFLIYRVFTSEAFEGNKKKKNLILEDFKKGNFDTLFSINCFTEGVDVPSVEKAILVASSTNPKEFVQRRGRVLRRYKGKKRAIINDILVFPPKGRDPIISEKLVNSEVIRCKIFLKDALNSENITKLLNDKLSEYGITEDN
jgi:superfamily II DNA or RNA helicase